jgi:hypothetical protein
MAVKEKITGRKWRCPKCKFILPEATIEYRIVTCERTLACKHKGGCTVMELMDEEEV